MKPFRGTYASLGFTQGASVPHNVARYLACPPVEVVIRDDGDDTAGFRDVDE
jgi:hypothetical protein